MNRAPEHRSMVRNTEHLTGSRGGGTAWLAEELIRRVDEAAR